MLEKRAKTNVSPGNKSPLPHFSDDDDECRCGLVASTVVAGGLDILPCHNKWLSFWLMIT